MVIAFELFIVCCFSCFLGCISQLAPQAVFLPFANKLQLIMQINIIFNFFPKLYILLHQVEVADLVHMQPPYF